MKVYKATDKDMKCRGFQYELGKTAEVKGDIELCKNGLHACEMPLDVLGYYAPGDGSRYFEAELEDVRDEKRSDDTKRVGKKLTLSAEIGIPGLVKAQVEYVKAQCDFDNAINKADAENKNHATGWRGAASATGNSGAASATGKYCVAMTTGFFGRVMGDIGNAIVCVERRDNGEIAAILAGIVDGETLKPGVWYTVKDGQWAEVQ
ncbi:MAG: hypothetical protein MR762_10465 [Clostridiales bacterium]|nr:hypothetical protein [Clostridiales bacterium]